MITVYGVTLSVILNTLVVNSLDSTVLTLVTVISL